MIYTYKFQLENVAANANITTTIQDAYKSALSTARSNIEWANQRKIQIDSYFDTTTQPTVPSPTTLCTTKAPEETEATTPQGDSGQFIKATVSLPIILLLSVQFFN